MNDQPGRFAAATLGLSGIEPKIAAFAPTRMSPGLRRTEARAMSAFPTPPWLRIATMIGGMMKTAMIAAIAYARRGVHDEMRLAP